MAEKNTIKIAVLGDPSVGKSSLISEFQNQVKNMSERLCNSKLSHVTFEEISGDKNKAEEQLQGQRYDGVFVIFDNSCKETLQKWLHYTDKQNACVILLANKSDLADPSHVNNLNQTVIYTSAKNKTNTNFALNKMISAIHSRKQYSALLGSR